ncbi:MAG TPA: MlaD family protein [Chthoniobacterales bacterium]
MKKLGDWAIALTVVACSVVLFVALAFALQGNPFNRPSRTLRAQFPDVTGVQVSSLVKYAGATAGTVHAVRMLTPKERLSSGHPENAIEITLSLNRNVPALSTGLLASVASDTLLSDKFVLLTGGDPKAPDLANDALIASVAPVTFDAILRDLSNALASIRQLIGSADGNALDGIIPKVDALLTQLTTTVNLAEALVANGNGLIGNANGLVKNGEGLVTNADHLVASGQNLIDSNRAAIDRMIAQLSTAANSLDQLARRTDTLIKSNAGNVTTTISETKETISELRATVQSARAFMESLRARPQQLLWGPGRRPRAEGTPAMN